MDSTLISELKRVGPKRYAAMDPRDAAYLAEKDVVEAPELMYPVTLEGEPVCKQFATDFFVRAARYSPHLITDQMVEAMTRVYPKCYPNGATQMNILLVLGLLKRKDCLVLVDDVIRTSNDELILDVAEEAKKVINGELEIGSEGSRKRWIRI